jgi:hypothetical protein
MLLRRIAPIMLLLGWSAASAANQGALSPFLGKWELDKKKTGSTGAPEKLQFEIEKDGDNGLVIKSQYQEPKNAIYPLLWVGVMTYELPLSLNGTPKTNHIGPFTHTSKTTINGNTMTTDFTAALEKGNVTGQWIRTVSPDGREMTMKVLTKASDGRKLDQTLVFKRK